MDGEQQQQPVPLNYEAISPRSGLVREAWRQAGLVFLTGLITGALCYLLAESLVPRHVQDAGDHDALLAVRIGFIYAPVVGLWLAWLQRSVWRGAFNAATGIFIGIIYLSMCASQDFLAIMVAFPCLLGGLLAVIAGSNRSPWLLGSVKRLLKGLAAGFVLGAVYMIVLNILARSMLSPLTPQNQFTASYVAMMWRAGPAALGAASACFFVLIRWAVGLTQAVIFTTRPNPRGGHL